VVINPGTVPATLSERRAFLSANEGPGSGAVDPCARPTERRAFTRAKEARVSTDECGVSTALGHPIRPCDRSAFMT